MIFARASSTAQVWAVDHESVQLTWGSFPGGRMSLDGLGAPRVFDHPGGPGSLVVDGCQPATEHRIIVRVEAETILHRLSVTTLDRPPGRLLCRVATISDLHLGARHWGVLKTMGEVSPVSGYHLPEIDHPADMAGVGLGSSSNRGPSLARPLVQRAATEEVPIPKPGHPPGPYPMPHPWRCASGAIDDAVAWGADLLVLKGDLLEHENAGCLESLSRLVDSYPDLPMMAIPGNHDVDAGGTTLPSTIGRRRLRIVRQVAHLDLPGLRVIVADTTIPNRGMGTLDRVAEDILAVAAESDRPILLLVHHQLQPHRVSHYWPVGVPAPHSTRLLDHLDELDQPVVVSSGHTHRNRVRRHRSVLVTEVASTKDWPGVWAGYNVFEGGIVQTVRRVSRHDAMIWTEYSRNAVAGLWAHWAPGSTADRCVVQTWSS